MSDHWNIYKEANERSSSDGTGWLMPWYCHAYRLVPQQLKSPLHYTPDNSICILSVQARIVAWDNQSFKTNTHKMQPYSNYFLCISGTAPTKTCQLEVNWMILFPSFFLLVFFLTSPLRWGHQCSAKQPERAEDSHRCGIFSHRKSFKSLQNTRNAWLDHLALLVQHWCMCHWGRAYFCLLPLALGQPQQLNMQDCC